MLASCAVPGLLPPVEIDGEHYFDGGLVDSIPVGRAVALGATTVYVLQVGRIKTVRWPRLRRPWRVGLVAFEIARRHRFHEEMSALPDGITVHVLPTGGKRPAAGKKPGVIKRVAGQTRGDRRAPDLSQLRYRDKTMVQESIERACEASAELSPGRPVTDTGLPGHQEEKRPCCHQGWSAGWCWHRWR